MQGKDDNVNLHKEIKNNNFYDYRVRKVKNFMYYSSLFSLLFAHSTMTNHDYEELVLALSCTLGFYSLGKLIGTPMPPLRLYRDNSTSEPIIIGSTIYELEEEKKCYTLSKHHD